MSAKRTRKRNARQRRVAPARSHDTQCLHALGVLVAQCFGRGLGLDETIAKLTIDAMKLGFEPRAAKKLISRYYQTCLDRQTDKEAIARLAEMDTIHYERNRVGEAKRLKMRERALDREVAKLRTNSGLATAGVAGAALNLKTPEPWPEPVDGAALLDELSAALRRFVILPARAADAIALWVLFAHAIDYFDVAPRLAILSAVMRSGKTTGLRVIARLVPRALLASNVSPAAIFRTIEAAHPSLLLDELDSLPRDDDERRGLLNSGHTRDASFVVRVVGDSHEPRKFSTWGPIVMAAIGKLPSTWLDRAIVIRVKRKLASEHVVRVTREGLSDLEILARKCARSTRDNATAFKSADPAPIAALDDRANDNWSPLLTIADAAGGDWPGRARAAALALAGGETSDVVGITLLRDIASVFDEEPSRTRWGSSELCERLVAIETAPWTTISRGKPITGARLVRLLRPFEIHVREDATGSYYRSADFADAFERYREPSPPSATVPQVLGAVSENEISKCHSKNGDGTSESATTPTGSDENGTMALSAPPAGDEESFEL
jgi:putative DNA primase/helicase